MSKCEVHVVKGIWNFFFFWLCWVFVAAWASRLGEQEPLFIEVLGLLTALASLVSGHRF